MGSYVVGCLAVLVILWEMGAGLNVLGFVAYVMFLCTSIPLIVTVAITEIVHEFLLERTLPIPLFVRTFTITVMLTLFGWLLVIIETSQTFGCD